MPTLAVLSMKGGVGKTSLTLGLASAAWQRGARVLVVDLDPQANASMGLGVVGVGIEPPKLTVSDVLEDPRPGIAAQAIIDSSWGPQVKVLPAERALEHRNYPDGPNSALRLRVALASVTRSFDLVLIDCPPSLGEMTRNALHIATNAAVVTEPGYFALHGAEQAIEAIDVIRTTTNPSLQSTLVVLNRVRMTVAEHRNRVAEIREAYPELVSEIIVPERNAIPQAEAACMPIHAWESPAGTELAGVFDSLLDAVAPRLRVVPAPVIEL